MWRSKVRAALRRSVPVWPGRLALALGLTSVSPSITIATFFTHTEIKCSKAIHFHAHLAAHQASLPRRLGTTLAMQSLSSSRQILYQRRPFFPRVSPFIRAVAPHTLLSGNTLATRVLSIWTQSRANTEKPSSCYQPASMDCRLLTVHSSGSIKTCR